ncbi:MAG: oleate hydratase [Methylococcales bacterium]|nr:oleate hydratase [Methylococcales bacterium]MDP3010336.1 oleate hydratase [Methylococcales bacterium]
MSHKQKTNIENTVVQNNNRKAYFVGGGIASLAAAAFLIRDGAFSGDNIHIFEELKVIGGSLDGAGSADKGYVIRGGRMIEEHYACTYDLFASIPALTDHTKSVKDEIFEFSDKYVTKSRCRLVKNGEKIDVSSFDLSEKDRLDLLALLIHSEDSLGAKRIEDWFSPEFFQHNFWLMWATMFAFQPWHSVVELKRYLLRFIQLFPDFNEMGGVWRTPYNQYDSMVLPLMTWLKEQGVHFLLDAKVTNVDFDLGNGCRSVKRVRYTCDGEHNTIALANRDLLFVTLGCMTEGSSLGSMNTPAILNSRQTGGAWSLWEDIANGRPGFGHPDVFANHIKHSKWQSFTVTLNEPAFFQLIEDFTGNEAGTGGLVTLVDSNWFMSIVLAHQPHFINQPDNTFVFWGYGLFPDRYGNFVNKPMTYCTGEEILMELLQHLKLGNKAESIIKTANCIPCLMPFITSQFLPRVKGDRPDVVPAGAQNFAFIGQFCEIPDDVVFTVEYSIRSALIAVCQLLNLEKEIPPVFKGQHDVAVLFNALKTMHQ